MNGITIGAQLAGAIVEGKLLSSHRFTLLGLLSQHGPPTLVMAICAAIAGGLLTLAVTSPDKNTLLPGILFAMIAAGCAIPAIIGFARRIRSATVYTDRLVWVDGTGEHEMGWDEVKSVHRFERITNEWFYQTALTIASRDGEAVVFNHSLLNFRFLAEHAQQLSAKHLIPKKAVKVRKGPVKFGPVSLSADGIEYGGRKHIWEFIEYAVSRGYLIIVPSGDDFEWGDRVEIALADIPNVVVLLELMAQLGKPPIDPSEVIPKSDRARMSRLRM